MQGRDDMGTRGDRNITQGTGQGADTRGQSNAPLASQQQQGGVERTVTQPGGWYERGRDDLRRRVENRFDRSYNAGYSSSSAYGGNYATGYQGQSYDHNPDRQNQGAMRGSEYDSYSREPNQSRDDQRFGGSFGATQGGSYYGGSMGHHPNEQRGYTGGDTHWGRPHTDDRWGSNVRARTSHDRDAQAYGDYGHPGGDRSAYGDMGASERRGGAVQRTSAGLGERMRRWRRGAQCARDVMTKSPKAVRPSDSLQHVAQVMIDEDTGIVPVIEEDNRLVGVITDRDMVCRLIARGVDLRAAKAADAMTDDVECVTEQHSLHDVLDIMSDHQVRRVPVVARGDRLVGIISMSDIAREADVDEDLQDTFEDISSRRGFWARLR
jgi:CBS domain-containing protein